MREQDRSRVNPLSNPKIVPKIRKGSGTGRRQTQAESGRRLPQSESAGSSAAQCAVKAQGAGTLWDFYNQCCQIRGVNSWRFLLSDCAGQKGCSAWRLWKRDTSITSRHTKMAQKKIEIIGGKHWHHLLQGAKISIKETQFPHIQNEVTDLSCFICQMKNVIIPASLHCCKD